MENIETEKPEAELVVRAKIGDHPAFEKLLKKYEVRIYNLAYRMLGNRSDAADVLQEAALKAYQALPRFQGRSSFGTWFYRIAANLCLVRLRSHKKVPFSLDTMLSKKGSSQEEEKTFEIADWSHNPAASLANKELHKILSDSIATLPAIYRSPFVLYEMEDLPVKQISEVLRISEPAVKTRLHRSRLLLREKLSEYFEHLKK
ncbi:MAG: sigma-70 family RNA polymerase sigma factor [Candidatus Omnitrophota bacterium]